MLCIGLCTAGGSVYAHASHGVVHIPSFYPHEISIETIDPTAAAGAFKKNALHAYVGSEPHFKEGIPEHLRPVESLDALLVLSFNPASKAVDKQQDRCALANGITATLARPSDDVVLSPYPVTPFHPDYLQHLDRIEEAKARVQAPTTGQTLRFKVKGKRAENLVRSRWALDSVKWDVQLQEMPVSELMSSSEGRLGPPWMKEGWFQAYQWLAAAVDKAEQQSIARTIYQRLTRGEYKDAREQLDLQRRLVATLVQTCNRVVVGYTLRREYYDDSYTGVENIAVDSQLGLNSPVFIRAVKLKDFPWNGELRLGTRETPEAAWNPVAGFSDPAGKMIWSSVGDPALLPFPSSSSWIPNRVESQVETRSGSQAFQVARDAFVPQAGTGALLPAGADKSSTASIIYHAKASIFHDGNETEIADLLYPYVFAYRWGVKTSDTDKTYDPAVDAATALMRQHLVGVRVLRVEQTTQDIGGEIAVTRKIPILKVYVNHLALDPRQMADLAPPWSSVPWHVLVLMEEAVQRGFAAFSNEEAKRRGIAWLDLARDASLQEKLKPLIEEFQRKGYRPDALTGLVDEHSARARWAALKKFAEERGHLLVTNGPYRLSRWSQHSAVLAVVRELTYPHGVGSFDHYAAAPRAIITDLKQEPGRVVMDVDVEMLVQQQRVYKTVRQRLTRQTLRGLYLLRPDSRYIILDAGGSVIHASAAKIEEDGRFMATLPAHLPRGQYTFLVAIYPDGNTVSPAVRIINFEATGS